MYLVVKDDAGMMFAICSERTIVRLCGDVSLVVVVVVNRGPLQVPVMRWFYAF